MDEFFFRHAEKEGVKVWDSTMVDSIDWTSTDYDNARPVAANWSNRKAGESGKITFDWLVDASGRNGVVQTKYLKNREFRESLRNVAVWGYWKWVYPISFSRRLLNVFKGHDTSR
jgi:flavin-dependent dehydrogenase